MTEEFNLSEERKKLFNSIPYFNIEGWDRTRIADIIREQDEELTKRLKDIRNEIFIEMEKPLKIEMEKPLKDKLDFLAFKVWLFDKLDEIDKLVGKNLS